MTSFIDATTVYGSSSKQLNLLLEADKKRLRMQENEKPEHGPLLPAKKDIKDPDECMSNLIDSTFGEADSNFNNINALEENVTALGDKNCDKCFVAGDGRVNEFPILTSFHTLFARLHNYAVSQLEKLNPHWSNERVFNEARLFGLKLILFNY